MPKKGKRDLVKERFWRKAIERYRASGKTRSKFCTDESLSADMLVYWSKVISERDAELISEDSVIAPKFFVPVTVADQDCPQSGTHQKAIAEIVLSSGSIFLFKGVDSVLLKALFQALRETTL
ncbi:hypothetical protein BH10CYA1_BH10CYA1_58560 [soil metagenome]